MEAIAYFSRKVAIGCQTKGATFCPMRCRQIRKTIGNLAQTAQNAIFQHNEEEHKAADWYEDNVNDAPKINVSTTS